MAFGTFLLVTGTALLDSVEETMTESITSTIAGHIQVHSADARDDLALYGGTFMGRQDIGRMTDFSKVHVALSAVDNVEAVVPMGSDWASVASGSDLDRALLDLRGAVEAGKEEHFERLIARVQQMAVVIRDDLTSRMKVAANTEELKAQVAEIDAILKPGFWAPFRGEGDQAAVIEHLDTHVAPLGKDAWIYWIRYLGTDLTLFSQKFDRFEIDRGEMVPEGRRGFLFNRKFHEDRIKHKVARELDQIHRAVFEEGKRIADDIVLSSKVDRNARQHRRVTFQLDSEEVAEVSAGLRAAMPGQEGDIDALVGEFLKVTDENLATRHRQFYELIAPRIRLYEWDVGDTLTIRSYTRAGYTRAVNVRIWGTFKFRGIEDSDLAGAFNLMDIISFRDLYGYMTPERRKELDQIRATVGVEDVARESAEDTLFGGGVADAPEAAPTEEDGFDEFSDVQLARRSGEQGPDEALHTQAQIDGGVALNAAVILRDPTRLRESMAAISAASEAAGLNLKVVDWRSASGMLGQFMVMVRGILYVAIFIVFLVALVIINNSMVMATLERTREIGTLRAIGATKGFVLAMFVLETVFLGLIAGGLGALLGFGLVNALGITGIPAFNKVSVFIFGGPRLFPAAGLAHLLTGLVVILFVSVVSTVYPAWIAARVRPIVAMQTGD